MNIRQTLACLCATLAVLLLAGCASTKPARFYVLRAPDEMPARPQQAEHLREKTVAVARVSIPHHLDRPGIVTRAGENELAYSEFQRWGAPLADNLAEVLVMDLATLLPESVVSTERALDTLHVDYRVQVVVRRMTGELGGEVMLDAQWGISAGNEESLLHSAVTQYRANTKGSDHAAYVATMSGLVLDLARDIAKALQEATGET